MMPGGADRHVRGCLQPDGSQALTHVGPRRTLGARERQRVRPPVEFEQQILQNHPAVRLDFRSRDLVVAVAIDRRENLLRDGYAGREADLEPDPIVLEGDARGLQILVQLVGICRSHTSEQHRDRRRSHPSHCAVSFAP